MLALANAASAQDLTPAWVRAPQVASGTAELHYGTFPLEHPTGPVAGSVIITGLADGSLGLDPTEVRMTRLSADGDVEWQANEPVDARPLGSTTAAAQVVAHAAPTGESAAAVQSDRDVEIVRIASDGSLRWRTTLSPTNATDGLFPNSLHVTTDGGLVVGFWQGDGSGSVAGSESCVVSRFDQSGTLLWTEESPAPFWCLTRVAWNGNVLLALMSGFADAELVALDESTGQQLWQTSLPDLPFIEALVPDTAGGVRASGRIAGSGDSKVVSIDPAGAIDWQKTLTNLTSIVSADVTENDDTVVLGATGKIVRLDAAGLLTWQLTKPLAPYTWTRVAADANGLTHVTRIGPIAGQSGVQPAIETIDAAGQPAGVTQLPSRGPHRSGSEDLATNRFGDLFFSGEIISSSSIRTRADVVRLGRFGDTFCTQTNPNSAGAIADLLLAGSPELAENHASLIATGIPPTQTALFLASLDAGMTPNPAGSQGTLCLGGQIGRYFELEEIRFASPEGLVSLAIDLEAMPTPALRRPALVGETWRFQAWYRDVNPTGTSNFTNAVLFDVQ